MLDKFSLESLHKHCPFLFNPIEASSSAPSPLASLDPFALVETRSLQWQSTTQPRKGLRRKILVFTHETSLVQNKTNIQFLMRTLESLGFQIRELTRNIPYPDPASYYLLHAQDSSGIQKFLSLEGYAYQDVCFVNAEQLHALFSYITKTINLTPYSPPSLSRISINTFNPLTNGLRIENSLINFLGTRESPSQRITSN